MAENIDKKITITLQGRDDGATATMSKVEAKATELERTLKKVGKITGVGGFKQASDVAEGFTGELGAVGRIAGIAAAAEGAGRLMKAVGDGLQDAVDKGESFSKVLDDLGNKIPIVGTLKQGFESLAVGIGKATAAAVGMDTEVAGRRGKIAAQAITNPIAAAGAAVDEVTGVADAKAEGDKLDQRTKDIRARIDANKKDDEAHNTAIRAGMNERQKIEADRDADLEKIMDRRREWGARNAGVSVEQEKKFAQEEALVKAQAGQKIAKATYDANEEINKANVARIEAAKEYQANQRKADEEALATIGETFKIQSDIQIKNLRDGGDKTGAELASIEEDYRQRIEAIGKELRRINEDPTLTQGEKDIQSGRLMTQQDAIGIQADTRTRSVQANAEKEAAEKTFDMQRKILQLQSDGGNKTVERELKKLDILKQYQETQKQIDEMLKDSALSEEQRASLRAQRAALPGLADKAILQAGKEDAQTRLQTQLGEKSSLMDTRGQTAFFNQSKATTAEQEMAKVTKESTKATTDLTKMLADTLKPLLEKLNTPGNEGWLD